MFPVQLLVVLSTVIIINHAATLNYENQKLFATSYEAGKTEKLNNKAYNQNYIETTSPSNFRLENLSGIQLNVNDLKSNGLIPKVNTLCSRYRINCPFN